MQHVSPGSVAKIGGDHLTHFVMAFVERVAMRFLALRPFFLFMPVDRTTKTVGGKLVGRGPVLDALLEPLLGLLLEPLLEALVRPLGAHDRPP